MAIIEDRSPTFETVLRGLIGCIRPPLCSSINELRRAMPKWLITKMNRGDIHFIFIPLNVRGLHYLTMPIQWNLSVTTTSTIRFGRYRQVSLYHGCWCPDSLHHQDISSHDIDYVKQVSPGLIRGRIITSYGISVIKLNNVNTCYASSEKFSR